MDIHQDRRLFRSAIVRGEIEIVEALLHQYPSFLYEHVVLKFRAIHLAAYHGHLDLIEILVQFAIQSAKIPETAKLKILTITDDQGFLPIHHAVMNQQVEMISELTERMVDVEIFPHQISSLTIPYLPSDIAKMSEEEYEEIFLEPKPDQRPQKWTLFHSLHNFPPTTQNSKPGTNLVPILISLGYWDILTPDRNGNTPLHFAAQCQNPAERVDAIVWILSGIRSLGFSIFEALEITNHQGETPFMYSWNRFIRYRLVKSQDIIASLNALRIFGENGSNELEWDLFLDGPIDPETILSLRHRVYFEMSLTQLLFLHS